MGKITLENSDGDWLIKWVSQNANYRLFSENLKQFIGEKVGVDSGHVKVVYNGGISGSLRP